MASGKSINGKRHRGLTALANAVTGVTSAAVNTVFSPNMNPDNKKVNFIIGMNTASHYILRKVIDPIAELGINADIYITDNIPKSPKHKEKLDRPETKHFAFHEHLVMDVVDPVLERFDRAHGLQLNYNGELAAHRQYTPRQLEEYYANKGVTIKIIDMADPSLPEKDRDINDPSFVQKMLDDPDFVLTVNIRGMQIMGQPLIDALESNTINGNKTRVINAHPGDVFAFPGTNIAFWARMKNYAMNVWTTHVIDKKIDHGPFLNRSQRALKSGKSLLQDMLAMTDDVAVMIRNHITTLFNGSEPAATPQSQDPKFRQKPKDANGNDTTYTYATHQEWIDGYNQHGIRIADPVGYIEALTVDYTGSLSGERSETLLHELATAMLAEQQRHIQEYHSTYGYYPPYFDPAKPNDYYIDVNKYPPYQPPGQNLAHGTPGHP